MMLPGFPGDGLCEPSTVQRVLHPRSESLCYYSQAPVVSVLSPGIPEERFQSPGAGVSACRKPLEVGDRTWFLLRSATSFNG